jgi:hypothetical protein
MFTVGKSRGFAELLGEHSGVFVQVEVLEGSIHLFHQQIVCPFRRVVFSHQLFLLFVRFNVEFCEPGVEVWLVEVADRKSTLFELILDAMRS